MNDDDMNIVREIMAGMAIRNYQTAEQFYKEVLTTTTGIDGFWTTWENREGGADSNIILVMNSNQIKDASPVTYDDAGKVIPLSERFDTSKQDIRFSLREVDGQQVVWVDENILASKPESMSAKKFIRNYLVDHIDDVYTIIESGSKVHPAKQLPQEYLYSREAQSHNKSNRNLFSAKLKIVPGIGEMVEIASNRRWEKTKHIHNKNAKYGVYRYDTRVAFESNGGAKAYTAELVILNADDGKKYLYDIVNIKKDDITAKRLMVKARSGGETAQQTNAINNSVLQTAESVNSERQNARATSVKMPFFAMSHQV